MKSTDLVMVAALLAAFPCALPGRRARNKPDELFGQLDKNKDGTLAADEVGDEQKSLFERLVRRSDKDSDGKLTKDEFLQGFKESAKSEKPKDDSDGRRGRGGRAAFDPDKLFDELDKNDDGKLTIDEMPERAREGIGAIFEKTGRDALSKDEFRKATERRRQFAGEGKRPRFGDGPPREGDAAAEGDGPPRRFGKRGDGPDPDGADQGPDRPRRRGRGMREGRGPQVPKLVELLDANKDQKISKDELTKAAELFDKLDTNKDGSLDMPELLGPPPGNRRGEGGPGDGARRRRPRDGGPRDGGPRDGGPEDKDGRGDNPPPGKDEPKKDSPDA